MKPFHPDDAIILFLDNDDSHYCWQRTVINEDN